MNTLQVVDIRLISNQEGLPVVNVIEAVNEGLRSYQIPIHTSWGIHRSNELLRSFDLGMNIEFKSYKQYGLLLDTIMDMLNVKKAFVSLKGQSNVQFAEVSSALIHELSFKYQAEGFSAYMDDIEGYVSEAIDLVLSIRKTTAQ